MAVPAVPGVRGATHSVRTSKCRRRPVSRLCLLCRAPGPATSAQEEEKEQQGGWSGSLLPPQRWQHPAPLGNLGSTAQARWQRAHQLPHPLNLAWLQGVRWAEDVVDNEFMNKKKSKSEC